jgi:hypothetical protein
VNRFALPPFLSDKETKNKGRGYSDEVESRDGNVVLIKWQDNKAGVYRVQFCGQRCTNNCEPLGQSEKNVRACTTT